eukprot:CAMPEP_0202066480 /NCGR_PEP_ID=MMETSP0963-20130614/53994_1 /ASSEMBLY_ACC=CAM_ASM_000494 /TAXON_ID=4773 /ORGANISM="Schizochytrium aggregatum, Strain ATCC28209" /LENGTH=114 /DNA_ID=CAMNT_0048633179 /DNA_START=194 /DNA_END=539 /DNA_ORIENTATION=+
MIRPYALSVHVDCRSETLHMVWCGSSKYPNHNIATVLPALRDETIHELTLYQSICSITLVGNQIHADGARAIAEALKTNTTLQQLDLTGNQIDDDGAGAIAEALETNTTLQELR